MTDIVERLKNQADAVGSSFGTEDPDEDGMNSADLLYFAAHEAALQPFADEYNEGGYAMSIALGYWSDQDTPMWVTTGDIRRAAEVFAKETDG